MYPYLVQIFQDRTPWFWNLSSISKHHLNFVENDNYVKYLHQCNDINGHKIWYKRYFLRKTERHTHTSQQCVEYLEMKLKFSFSCVKVSCKLKIQQLHSCRPSNVIIKLLWLWVLWGMWETQQEPVVLLTV